jgi:precorrin-2 methylase
MPRPVILAALLVLPGCSAVSAATSVVTMPVRAASKAVDVATVSQSERDEARGRELRQQEERLGQLDRRYRKQAAACEQGDEAACAQRDATGREIEALTSGQYNRSE